MKKKTGVTIVGVFVALLLIAAVLCVALVKKYTPNKEYVTGEEYAPVAEGEAHVIFWQEKYEKNALLLNGGIYLDLETVLSHINEDFYYDEEELVLSYTTPTEIIRAYPMEAVYYRNNHQSFAGKEQHDSSTAWRDFGRDPQGSVQMGERKLPGRRFASADCGLLRSVH